MKQYLLLLMAGLLLLAGCAKEAEQAAAPTPTPEVVAADDTWAKALQEAEAQSEAIKYSLEHDDLNQMQLNETAKELYVLWDDLLNRLWGQLERTMPEAEFAVLLQEQLTWIADKEAAVAEAGRMYEGGSIYPLIIHTEGARITEARVYELYEYLK